MKLDDDPQESETHLSPQPGRVELTQNISDDGSPRPETVVPNLVNHGALTVAGYAVPWSTKAGRAVDLHLSSASPVTAVAVQRLDTPEPEVQNWSVEAGENACGVQALEQGSYLSVEADALAKVEQVKEIGFEFYLTRNPGERTLLLADDLRICVNNDQLMLFKGSKSLGLDETIPSNSWLSLTIKQSRGRIHLDITSSDQLAPYQFEFTVECDALGALDEDLLIGWDGDLNRAKLNSKYANLHLKTTKGKVAWTFPARLPEGDIPSSGRTTTLRLRVHNLPTFCMSSMRWDGTSYDPKLVPSHYDAIHCHDDDLGPLDWPVSYRVEVPDDATAGVYAFQVSTENSIEEIAFFVASSNVTAPLVFLVPTATYLAYSDETLPEQHFPWKCEDRGHRFAVDNNLRSLYDYHSDLSGVSICSYKKPKATLRSDYEYPLCGTPHNLPVDLHLLKFLHRNGIAFDLITDHDLHAGGLSQLEGYNAVVTGSHPEYMSTEMEGALRAFAASGGSIAYLGGNGFSATVAIQDDLMELRRSSLEAGRTWDGWVGEQAMAITNEPGGLLRNRGRGEFSLIGGAISLMGFEQAHPYTRTEESRAEDVSWLFEGVEDDTFGHDGIVLGGAAGYEVDATDHHLGTSPDTIVLARATGFSSDFLQDITRWYEGGLEEMFSKRCAEMTVRHLPTGSLIYSASSVAWCGALPGDGKMNDVGRVTLNLLTRLSSS